MSRKHKRAAATFLRELELEDEIHREQRKYADQRELWMAEEQAKMARYRAIYGDDANRISSAELPHRNQMTRQERAQWEIGICFIPGCLNEMIRMVGRPLGVCAGHGMDIADYFEWIVETTEISHRAADREFQNRKQQQIERKQRAARRITPGWIYYLLVGEHIKIGYTKDVKRRLKSYPPGSRLLALHPGTKQLEHDTHTIFVGSRAAGREWFLDTPELRDHIKQVIAEFGEPDRARYEHHGTGRNRSKLKAS